MCIVGCILSNSTSQKHLRHRFSAGFQFKDGPTIAPRTDLWLNSFVRRAHLELIPDAGEAKLSGIVNGMYLLVNSHIAMENHHFFMGKSAIKMAIFNSKLLVYKGIMDLFFFFCGERIGDDILFRSFILDI